MSATLRRSSALGASSSNMEKFCDADRTDYVGWSAIFIGHALLSSNDLSKPEVTEVECELPLVGEINRVLAAKGRPFRRQDAGRRRDHRRHRPGPGRPVGRGRRQRRGGRGRAAPGRSADHRRAGRRGPGGGVPHRRGRQPAGGLPDRRRGQQRPVVLERRLRRQQPAVPGGPDPALLRQPPCPAAARRRRRPGPSTARPTRRSTSTCPSSTR